MADDSLDFTNTVLSYAMLPQEIDACYGFWSVYVFYSLACKKGVSSFAQIRMPLSQPLLNGLFLKMCAQL